MERTGRNPLWTLDQQVIVLERDISKDIPAERQKAHKDLTAGRSNLVTMGDPADHQTFVYDGEVLFEDRGRPEQAMSNALSTSPNVAFTNHAGSVVDLSKRLPRNGEAVTGDSTYYFYRGRLMDSTTNTEVSIDKVEEIMDDAWAYKLRDYRATAVMRTDLDKQKAFTKVAVAQEGAVNVRTEGAAVTRGALYMKLPRYADFHGLDDSEHRFDDVGYGSATDMTNTRSPLTDDGVLRARLVSLRKEVSEMGWGVTVVRYVNNITGQYEDMRFISNQIGVGSRHTDDGAHIYTTLAFGA